jgi:hypothetical protein
MEANSVSFASKKRAEIISVRVIGSTDELQTSTNLTDFTFQASVSWVEFRHFSFVTAGFIVVTLTANVPMQFI